MWKWRSLRSSEGAEEPWGPRGDCACWGRGADRAAPRRTGAVYKEIPPTLKAAPIPPAALPRPEDSCQEGLLGEKGCSVHVPASQCVLLRADDKAEKGDEKDSAVVTQSDDAPAEEDHLGPNCYYDKSKSFFDNISSELKTRSGGRGRTRGSGLARPGWAGRETLVLPHTP